MTCRSTAVARAPMMLCAVATLAVALHTAPARAQDRSVPEPDPWACDPVEAQELAICNGDVPDDRPGPWTVWDRSFGGWTGAWKTKAAAVQSCERSNRAWQALFHEPGPEDCASATCAACPPGDPFDRARGEMLTGLAATLALDVVGRAEGSLVGLLATTLSEVTGLGGAWASTVRRLDAVRRETQLNARKALRGALSAPQEAIADMMRGELLKLDEVQVASGMVLAHGLRSSNASAYDASPLPRRPLPWIGFPPWGVAQLGVAVSPAGSAPSPDARSRQEQVRFIARHAAGVERVLVMNGGTEAVRVRVRTIEGAQQEMQLGPTTVEFVDFPGTYVVLRPTGWYSAGVAVELMSECPAGMRLQQDPSGGRCVCAEGSRWDPATRSCQRSTCPPGMRAVDEGVGVRCACPPGQRFDRPRDACVPDTCAGGSTWDPVKGACGCLKGQFWSTAQLRCEAIACSGGTVFDAAREACACPSGMSFSSSARACVCPSGMSYSASAQACVCPSGMSYSASAGACVCPSGTSYAASAGGCVCPSGMSYSASAGGCVRPSGEGEVSSRDVTISVIDSNAVQDDFYDVYVNGTKVGEAHNAPGATSTMNATLQSGSNLIELRMVAKQGKDTELTLRIDPGPFKQVFAGTQNHFFRITAP